MLRRITGLLNRPEYFYRPSQLLRWLRMEIFDSGKVERNELPWGITIRFSPNWGDEVVCIVHKPAH